MEYTARMNENALVSRAAAAGSCVLLKNVENTLPFTGKDGAPVRLAVFGIGQIFTPTGPNTVTPWRRVNLLDALCASEEVTVDGLLAHKYRAWAVEHPDGSELPLGSLSMEEFAENNDAAVIVLARDAAQSLPRLTPFEQDMLKKVNASFSRTALVLAVPGYLELTQEARACGAILFLGLAGQEAGTAACDILTGRVCPSGKLAFSWPERFDAFAAANAQPDNFCGYRYFDTFGGEILYPFGYGLGYGKAELGAISVGLDGCDITVSVAVENTGEVYPVQEVIQVYCSLPSSGAGEPAWILSCYQKTRPLSPGETQTVQLRFPVTELSRFRAQASAFVLEEGYYDIRVGTSSRATCLAGSIRLSRSAVVQAVTPCALQAPALSARQEAVQLFTYPGEGDEREAAHRRAIRLSDRNLPRRSRKKGRPFTGCRADGEAHTLLDVKEGRCNAFTFVASLDDHSLRRLVCDFGFCPSPVPGALGASCELPRYGLAPMTIAAGVGGLSLQRDIEQEDDTVRHQYATGFPAPGTLACSFDPALILSVGRAIGREMQEFGVSFCLCPGSALLRTPTAPDAAQCWSEDPVVSGLCARSLAEGIERFGAAVLCAGAPSSDAAPALDAFRELDGLSFEIAAGCHSACLLPNSSLYGEPLGEDSALVRSLILDWKYSGMFLSDGERYVHEPDRTTLERSALRIVRVMARLAR